MSPAGRDLPVRTGCERCLGWRPVGWLGALMLCVVLAAAGMPAGGGTVVDGARIEACRDHQGQALPRATARSAADARPGAAAVTAALPRPRPRAHTIESGGLPPPRAPTV
jgi:hypothetical protein